MTLRLEALAKKKEPAPAWCPPPLNQYGLLKLLRINENGTYIDGCRISNVTITDTTLDQKSDIKIRLGVVANDENIGGLTLYRKNFGNYPQDNQDIRISLQE